MGSSRRNFCATVVGVGLALPMVDAFNDGESQHGPRGSTGVNPFLHGVASGDPLADRVILWTRVSPQVDTLVRVDWHVAIDPGMRDITASGTLTTNADRDFTVKAEPLGLRPGTTYHYRLAPWVLNQQSAGRGRCRWVRFAACVWRSLHAPILRAAFSTLMR